MGSLGARLQLLLVWLALRMAPLHPFPVHASNSPAAATDGLHPEDPFVTGQHLAPLPLQLPPAHDRGHCAVLARHSDDFALLEEGRSKRLLSSVPPGLGTAAEVAKRLTLWEESRFEYLLPRAEEQLLILRRTGKRKKRDAQPDPLARADRARRTAAVGGYRKVSRRCSPSKRRRVSPGPKSSFPFPPWERKPAATWRWNLLRLLRPPPPRVRIGIGPSPDCIAPPSVLQVPRALGRNTSRISVPRRIHANKLHAALSAVFCQISAGTLSPAARWLTRTRLCWQRKKSGETHQDGRAPAVGQCQTARQSAPGHPSLQGPAHASVEHQAARCL